jgi:hypothetical protein
VHPDPVQQDEVEVIIEGVDSVQCRETIVNPLDSRGRMDFLGALAESIDRFYSYYLVVLRSEPRSVPSGTCPDVKNQELGAWK